MVARRTGLNDLELLFCNEYIVNFNATSAAISAGYKGKSARVQGCLLLKKPHIEKYLAKIMKKRIARVEVTQDRVIEEYAKIAFLDPKKLFDEFGVLKSIHEMDADTASAIASFSKKKGLGRLGPSFDIKFSDKRGALDSLARHLGMFNDKFSFGGQKDNPIKTENTTIEPDLSHLTDEQLNALELLTSGNATSPKDSDFDL